MLTQDTHPGNMPTRVLRYNIDDKFSNIRPEVRQMHEKEKDGKVQRAINNYINKDPIESPNANGATGQINISENFIAYLWCICYYFFMIQEYIQYRLKKNDWDGVINYGIPVLGRAKALFDWACSLRYQYSDWDLRLPNPDIDNSDLPDYEIDFIGKTNNLFMTSIVYVLFHEYSHIVNGHCEALMELRKKGELTSDELLLLKSYEQEADNFAFDTIIKYYDDEKNQMLKTISILMVHISNLFLLKDPNSIIQEKHPDVDIRLYNAITKISYLNNENNFYIMSLSTLAFNIFFTKHNIKIEQEYYETVDDMMSDYLRIFDDIKEEQEKC